MHALIEKPLAQDVPSSTRLAEAFERPGLVGAVGHIERYNPALQQARRRLEAGDLGEVYQVAHPAAGPVPGADRRRRRRQGPRHPRHRPHRVGHPAAASPRSRPGWRTRAGGEHEDLVGVVGQLADGTVTNHLVNWLSPIKERVTIVTGEQGAFVADTLTADLTFYANGVDRAASGTQIARFRGVSEGDVIRYAIPKPEPLRIEHEAFRDAVLGKEADIVTMRRACAPCSSPRRA